MYPKRIKKAVVQINRIQLDCIKRREDDLIEENIRSLEVLLIPSNENES